MHNLFAQSFRRHRLTDATSPRLPDARATGQPSSDSVFSGKTGRALAQDRQLVMSRGVGREIELRAGAETDVDDAGDPVLRRRWLSQRHVQSVAFGAYGSFQCSAEGLPGLPLIQILAVGRAHRR